MASLDPHRQIFISRAEQPHPSPPAPAPPPPAAVRSLHPSLPLDSDPNPRIAAFVRSQQQHSSFYRQEGLALFSGWLDDQRSKEEAAAAGKRTPSAKGKEREREKPRAPGNEGIRAVDVLGGLGGGGPSSSSAGLTGKGGVSSGESRVRMADRMRGKDGSSKKAGTGTSRKRRNDEDEGEESGGRPEGSEIVLTRRESEGRALGKDKVDAPSSSAKHLPPTSNHPSTKQPVASTSSKPLLVEASNAEDRPRDRDGKKRPRLDPVEEHNDDEHNESPPSPAAQPPFPSPPRKAKASSSKPAKNAPPPSPPPRASSSKPKSKSKSANEPSCSKPSKLSGKENLEAEEHAVRLEERKSRRRAKAEIVKPKPTTTTAAAASSSDSSSAESDATDDADSRRKTRRVRKRKGSSSRRAVEEDESEESEGEARKRRKKEKEKAGGKGGKKKENRDLGASIGMGLGIMDTFKAGNLGGGPSRRLTLKREVAKPGVFNKGRSSSKVVTKGKRSRDAVGVQDLVFSESRFLSRPRPPLNSASSASVDPEPQSRPHRSSKSRHKSPSHPTPADKKRKPRVVEDSDELEEGSDDDRPVETVSKFFAVSKTKDKVSKGKAREEPERQRVDYSPSWPDVAEEDEESRRASEQGRSRNPAPSVHSTTRQGNARSLSSRHAPSHDAASTSRSHHSQPQPRAPSSRRAASSHHSQPNAALSSKPRTSGAPLPSSRPSNPPQQPESASVDVLLRACETGRLPSPARRGSQQQVKLVYDGTSSVGDYEVFVEIEVDGNGYNGCWDQEAEEWRGRGGRVDRKQEDAYSRSFDQPARYLDGPWCDQDDHQDDQLSYLPADDGLSGLGAEADVYRSAGHDFKTQTSSRRLHLPSRFDVDGPLFDQQPPHQHQDQYQSLDDMEDDQPMQDGYQLNDDFGDIGFDPPPFLNNNQHSPPPQAPSSRNRPPFHPYSNDPQYQQEAEFFSDEEQEEEAPQFDEQQQPHTLLSDIPDEEEEDEGMFGVQEEEEVHLRGHWRRHRT